MATLSRTVFVTDPDRAGTSIRLDAGQEVPAHLEHLVTNPDAWEDSEPPTAAKKAAAGADPDPADSADTKTAVKKTATTPARGRKAGGEGTGGH